MERPEGRHLECLPSVGEFRVVAIRKLAPQSWSLALGHLQAAPGIERVVDIELVFQVLFIIGIAQAEPGGNRFEAARDRISVYILGYIGGVDDLGQPYQTRVGEAIFEHDGLERAAALVVAELHAGRIEWYGPCFLSNLVYLALGHKQKFRLIVHEPQDQPRAGHAVHVHVRASQPFHCWSPFVLRARRVPDWNPSRYSLWIATPPAPPGRRPYVWARWAGEPDAVVRSASGVAGCSSNLTSGIFLSKKIFLWLTLIDRATARSAWITPRCRAAAAMRVWQRVSMLLMLAVLAAEPTAMPRSIARNWQMGPGNSQSSASGVRCAGAARRNSAQVA